MWTEAHEDLLDAAEEASREAPDNSSFQEEHGRVLFDPPSGAVKSGGMGYCALEPMSVTLWGVVFHLALFATFFMVFFQFALRPKYTHFEENLGKLTAALAASKINKNTDAVAAAMRKEQAQRAADALAKRQKKNDRLFGAAAVPVAALWILTIGWGVVVRRRGHKVLPTMRGAGVMFVTFLVTEILIFVFVVNKYKPLNGADLVEILKKAFAKRLAACAASKTPMGERLPVNRIADSMLGRPQPGAAPGPSGPGPIATQRAGPLTIQTKIYKD